MGTINQPIKRTCAWYIITATNYLNRWVEATPVKDCTVATAIKFLFDNVVTRFGCPDILMWLRHTLCPSVDLRTNWRIPYPTQEDNTISPTSEWWCLSIQQDPRKHIDKYLQCSKRWLGPGNLCGTMILLHDL